MSTVKFGLQCDGCTYKENDYHVDTIRTCEDCERDLCPACAKRTGHVEGAEADVDQQPTWQAAEGMHRFEEVASE